MTATTTTTFDGERAERFAGQMIGVLNGGMLSLMVSIGHRTGLFDTMAELPPASSTRIADVAGLDERYVREWLGAMVTGGIVEYDRADATYALPAEHAAFLTRAAGIENIATITQFVPLLASVHEDIERCFREGGGVGYGAFGDFVQLMAEESAQTFDNRLVDHILPLVEGIPERLAAGIDVLDVGCGAGHAINLMATTYPQSRFVGVDLSEEAIAAARDEAATQGLGNVTFELADAATLDFEDAFDLVTTFDSVHDQARPQALLDNVARALRPDGTYLCVDVAASSEVADNIAHPLGPTLYSISTMHCMTVSLAEGGAGLGTVWGEQRAREMLAKAGFRDVRVERIDGDVFNNYYICRR